MFFAGLSLVFCVLLYSYVVWQEREFILQSNRANNHPRSVLLGQSFLKATVPMEVEPSGVPGVVEEKSDPSPEEAKDIQTIEVNDGMSNNEIKI